MRHLGWLDRALLVTGAVLWFGFSVSSIPWLVQPPAMPPVFTSGAGVGDYPVVAGLRGYAGSAEPGLAVGDRVLRVGERDFRDASGVDFYVGFVAEVEPDQPTPVVVERDSARLELVLRTPGATMFRSAVFTGLVFGLVGIFLLLRSRGAPALAGFGRAFLSVALLFAALPVSYAGLAGQALAMAFVAPLSLRAFESFPTPPPSRSAWSRYGIWIFALLSPLHLSRFGLPIPVALAVPATIVGVVGFLVSLLVMTTRSYRRSDLIQRRQLRWVLYGIYCAALPPMLLGASTLISPALTPLYVMSLAALSLFPVALLISIARFNLFDIDRLISATASYNVILVGAVAAGLAIVPRAAEAAATLLGLDAPFGQVGVAVLLAAAVIPAHRMLRPRIERAFFEERFKLDRGVERLLTALGDCTSPEELTVRVGQGLLDVFEPDGCVIYGRLEQSHVPVFAVGRAVPPAFAPDGPLLATLATRREPLAFEGKRWRGRTELSPFDRAVLETLDCELVAAVRHGTALAYVICLGSRRSGDVYTPIDARLLAAVADRVSTRLERFDQEEMIRQGRLMQQALRRYVPGAVVEQLETGGETELGVREVSVLFADLRGYTSYSEEQRPEEIFSTVNRYTQALSDVVRKHGGSVVEFNGDGMMVVFGAPHPLASKERSAVEAGREVLRAVGAITPEGGERPLSVGIGVATGPGFVGNIRSVDRLIWSVVGNTTNLAARLQAMTRDLPASMVIDSTTQARAGAAASGFAAHEQVPIRGRHEPQDVYALPLSASP